MIALIGGDGSIGRRYQGILNYLGHNFRVIEQGDSKENLDGCDKAIICTPTDTHEEWCWESFYKGIPFLCEKPLSKNKEAIKSLMSREAVGYVVNNWAFVSTNFDNKQPTHLFYDFFNTGKDGLIWDVCQLVLIADKARCPLEVRTDSFWWHAEWGEKEIPYPFIEQSYMQMIRAFMWNDWQRLWGLNKAYRMSECCENLEKALGRDCEGFNWSPSTQWVEKIPKKDLREHRSEELNSVGL